MSESAFERIREAADRKLAEMTPEERQDWEIRNDLMIYGSAVVIVKPDGSKHRIPPCDWPHDGELDSFERKSDE